MTETDSKLEASVLRNKISEHFTVLLERFEMYFMSEEGLRRHDGWNRNHFLTSEH